MKCWPIIRHLRAIILRWRLSEGWTCKECGFGMMPEENDIAVIRDVWAGRA